MTLLALIRHGPTDWNREKRLQGRVDNGLSEAGRTAVSEWRLPPDLNGFEWIASPLSRAVETARILTGKTVPTDPRLTEMSFGDWEGQVLDELRTSLGASMVENEARGLDFLPPGGESPRMVIERLEGFWQDIARSEKPTIAVCHKAVIRACYAAATGWNMKNKPPNRLENGCAQVFAVTGSGGITVKALNVSLTGER
ncbi:MAG: histidine phosphatase family protein [Alphaproteobacteria bacterium]